MQAEVQELQSTVNDREAQVSAAQQACGSTTVVSETRDGLGALRKTTTRARVRAHAHTFACLLLVCLSPPSPHRSKHCKREHPT